MTASDKERIRPLASGIFAAVSSLVLAACGEARPMVTPVPKAPPAAPPTPPFTAPITEHPVYSLVGDRPSPPDCPVVPDQEWPPLVFEPFPLPPGTRGIRSVIGYNERDVWLLADTLQLPNKLLHWDGVSLQEEPVSGCQLVPSSGELMIGPSGLIIAEEALTETETYYEVLRRSPHGSWECDDQDNDARFIMVGESELRLPIWVNYARLDGRSIPTPFPTPFSLDYPRAVGRGAEDFWVYARRSSKVAHWNGVDWETPRIGLNGVERMAIDRQGDLWLLGYTEKKWVMLRWKRDANTPACVPLPPKFSTDILLVGSETDIWFIGSLKTYHWNGTVLHAGPTPVKHPTDAWLDADGTLWITGETDDYKGVVFRSRLGEKP